MIDTLSDAELVGGLQSGRLGVKPVVAALYERHARAVFHYALMWHPGDEATADDVMQEVFLALCTDIRKIDPAKSPVDRWLLRAARFRCLDRKKRSRPEPLGETERDAAPGAAEVRSTRVTASLMRKAVFALPEEQRVAFGLRADGEKTVKEVAEVLECSVATAKRHIGAARAQLRAVAERLGVI